MLGAGIFINTTELAQRAGMLGAFGYVLIGLLMLPLILSITTLLNKYPGGSFYTFGSKEIHPLAGFISAWSYFTGKLASATLMLHAAVLLTQQVFPALAVLPPLLCDIALLTLFVALNLLHIRTGSIIQMFFMGVKALPILLLVVTGVFYFQPHTLTAPHFHWQGLPGIMPLVLYATVGFEAAWLLEQQNQRCTHQCPTCGIDFLCNLD